MLLEQPVRTAEFLAVDTETNGLGGDACELTEIGAVLVGGGELHDRWESLVRTNLPLGRGIQRFTGITQDMVDCAPEPEAVLPELARLMQGRVMVAHNAPFDRRVLRQAFERVGLEWPDPPVICTAAMARTLLPLQRERRLGALARALDIEVDVAHRALADAETCGRVLCALFPRLCANAITVADALALLRRRRASRRASGNGRGARRGTIRAAATRRRGDAVTAGLPEPDFDKLPRDPGVYLFRDAIGRTLYVGKSVSIRSRARAHFAPSAPQSKWTDHATIVDYRATRSELGALVLENRLIKELRPPGNVRLTRAEEGLVYIRCRLDIPFPILEVAPTPAAGHAVSIGPLGLAPVRDAAPGAMSGRPSGGVRRLALELVEQLDSLFGLRHCGRALPRRQHPSAYGQMGRCLSPCLGDLDPNLYRRRLDAALSAFLDPSGQGRRRLIDHVHAQMRAAAAEQHYERAAWLRRRARRLRRILDRLDGVLQATHVAPRLIVAPHPAGAGADAFWLVGGRLHDWGPLPSEPGELEERTVAALRHRGRVGEVGAQVPPQEIDELRIIGSYLHSHPRIPQLQLWPPPAREELAAFAASATSVPVGAPAQANGSATTSPATPASPTVTGAPSGASRRTSPSASGPSLGETVALETLPTARSA